MSTASICRSIALVVVALALAGCRVDTTGARVEASMGQVVDPPHLSDWSAPANLSEPVNSPVVEGTPVVSKDGLSLYFAAGRGRLPNCGSQDIWVSTRSSVDEPWGAPQNLGCTVNSAAHDNEPTLSRDGHLLYFTRTEGSVLGVGQDLYVSRRHDKRDNFAWQTPLKVAGDVNSTANESGAALLDDEATGTIILYFVSDRSGGLGGSDIYASTLQPDETFGPPLLVEELSSPFEDVMPEIRRDGLEVFLASDRTGTLGNLDLWVATRASTAHDWSVPVNLGAGINSAFFDGGPALSFRGTELYFQSAFRPENIGGPMFDIWVSTRSKVKDFRSANLIVRP
jgi:Tol biopolymer transport system component